jgi:hypothetical protein
MCAQVWICEKVSDSVFFKNFSNSEELFDELAPCRLPFGDDLLSSIFANIYKYLCKYSIAWKYLLTESRLYGPRPFATPMPSWNTLAPEIRELILYHFCAGIALDFKDLGATIWDTSEEEDLDAYHENLTWPNPPQCLLSFVAALRTSRYFHDTITNRTKLNGESAVSVIQRIQFQTILDMVDELFEQESSDPVSVKLFYKAAGCFWRNPMVLGVIDVPRGGSILGDVLMWIGPQSRFMLIPHLEHWLSRHAIKRKPGSGNGAEECHIVPFMEGGTFCEGSLKKGELEIEAKSFNASTIMGEMIQAPSLIVKNERMFYAIHQSPPDSWWYIPPEDLGSLYDDEEFGGQWFLVNYEEQRIFRGPSPRFSFYWLDIWNVDSWTESERDGR